MFLVTRNVPTFVWPCGFMFAYKPECLSVCSK